MELWSTIDSTVRDPTIDLTFRWIESDRNLLSSVTEPLSAIDISFLSAHILLLAKIDHTFYPTTINSKNIKLSWVQLNKFSWTTVHYRPNGKRPNKKFNIQMC